MIFLYKEVQDLAWVIRSIPLISGVFSDVNWLSADFFEDEYHECLPRLKDLDRNPDKLLGELAKYRPYILGRRFETFVEYWLKISPNFELLAKSHVLQGEQRTLGELDFIIKDLRRDKIIHLEVSVKFYLKKGDSELMSDWYGSNLKDRLDLKFNKLAEQQTQLSLKYPNLIPYKIDERWCMFKGRMFYPASENLACTKKPAFFNLNCLEGKWCFLGDLNPTKYYQHLDKQQWLRKLDNFSGENLDLNTKLELSKCCAEFVSRKGAERRRVFVLPDDFWS